ncbi:hypothetical protein SRHO_G00060400 [Serrasalmus rhombeus]
MSVGRTRLESLPVRQAVVPSFPAARRQNEAAAAFKMEVQRQQLRRIQSGGEGEKLKETDRTEGAALKEVRTAEQEQPLSAICGQLWRSYTIDVGTGRSNHVCLRAGGERETQVRTAEQEQPLSAICGQLWRSYTIDVGTGRSNHVCLRAGGERETQLTT